METKNFFLDCLGETPLEGYDSGELWNGWACPLFSFEQAQALVEAWQTHRWAAHYDKATDAFVFSVNQDLESGHSDEFDTFPAVEHKGARYYPIGSSAWTWDVEETAEPQGTAKLTP